MTEQLTFLSDLEEVEEVEILKISIKVGDGKHTEFVIGSKRNGVVFIPSIVPELIARKVVKGGVISRFGILNINLPLGDYNGILNSLYNEVVKLC